MSEATKKEKNKEEKEETKFNLKEAVDEEKKCQERTKRLVGLNYQKPYYKTDENGKPID